MTIREAWVVYLGVLAEGDKLRAEGGKLHAEGSKLCAEGGKLHAEGSKLCAEGNKLYAEGRIAFLNVVISNLGNVATKWINCWNSIKIAGITYTSYTNEPWNKEETCEGKIVEIDGRKYQLKLG